ncbi:MarR family winged helix-turn-helix transcriptional regulator [Chitinophaga sp. RCC_12]|uniref:MarR family winged helix-turn-helix transcriptional regulator n=1 Tax=Chitinophaga sp. RCC_12 TaxID=3239226 RepID=UPI003525B56D
MNKTVDLVNHWAAFEKAHPQGEILDFCRYMLTKKREDKPNQHFLGGAVPPDPHSKLAKLIGRIAKIHVVLSLPILKEHGINSFEDFAFLNSIFKLENPRKTDVINSNFIELSSGLLIIDRLRKNGWISEKDDDADKRSKRLSISSKGKKVLEQVYKRMAELNKQCFGNISDDDIMLCIQLMSPVESALMASWLKSKGK